MDYFKISSKKLDRYATKYSNNPILAYFKLAVLSCKMLGREIVDYSYGAIRTNKRIRIAIILKGGLGDVLFGGIYANAFIKNFRVGSETSVYVAQSVEVIRTVFNKISNIQFEQLNTFNERNFDLVISLTIMFPRVVKFSSFLKKKSDLFEYILQLKQFEEKLTRILADDRQLNQLLWMLGSGLNRLTALNIAGNLDINENFTLQVPEAGYSIFERFPHLKNKKFITISRGVDAKNSYKDSIRLWSVKKYEEFIAEFKFTYPEYNIVYLGSDKASCEKIEGVDINLVGETSISELMVVLNESKIHFDGECGMVHLRHFICRKPSIVLFGPTSPKLKGYSENINIRNGCSCPLPMCEHILLDGKWANTCLKNTTARGACIESISVKQVMDAFNILLK